jgi:hypothetical protein
MPTAPPLGSPKVLEKEPLLRLAHFCQRSMLPHNSLKPKILSFKKIWKVRLNVNIRQDLQKFAELFPPPGGGGTQWND